MSKIINKPIGNRKLYQVAVFYPNGWEAYGGITTCESKVEAHQERARLLSLNFEHVHIWTVTTNMIQT